MAMTSVYLIRHAQALGNVQRRFQGRVDQDLTDLGRAQARKAAKRMRAIPLAAVYSSPLKRAWETALSITASRKMEPVRCDGVIEIDGGAMENLLLDELQLHYPVEAGQFFGEPHNFMGVGGGESFSAVYDRMRDTILELVARHPDQNIAVVSHGAAIRCFMCYALGLPLERMAEVGWGGNTAVSHIIFNADCRQVYSLFDTSHLDPPPPLAAKEAADRL